MRKTKILLSVLVVSSLVGCGNEKILSKYEKGDVISVLAGDIGDRTVYKDGEEIVYLKDKDEFKESKDAILVLNKDKDKVTVIEKAEEGFVIGMREVIDDLLIWEEYEEKETDIKYKIKCRKLDSEEVFLVKEAGLENMDYSVFFDVRYNGKDIAYRFVEFDKQIVETYNLETKETKVQHMVERKGAVDKNNELKMGEDISVIDLNKEYITFAENTTNEKNLYYYKLSEKPKVIKSFTGCKIRETFLSDNYIYLNCSKGKTGLEHIKSVNLKTLEEKVLITGDDLKKVYKDYSIDSDSVYIESVTDETIKLKTNTDKSFIYNISDNKIEEVKK
ncbi:MAG: hypothetical protein ACRC28_07320 [Clostridium sp.]|uniref:hypothetical protein n=1 Tax=Clostridium sp. TaxID=1506 RepID=UPI003F3DC959